MRQKVRALATGIDAAHRERAATLRQVAQIVSEILAAPELLAEKIEGLPFRLRSMADAAGREEGDERHIRHTIRELKRFEDVAERAGRAQGLRRAAKLAGELGRRDPAVRRFIDGLVLEAEAVAMYQGDDDATRSR